MSRRLLLLKLAQEIEETRSKKINHLYYPLVQSLFPSIYLGIPYLVRSSYEEI